MGTDVISSTVTFGKDKVATEVEDSSLLDNTVEMCCCLLSDMVE